MSEQYVPKLGQIIAPDDQNARRDCIHVAIAPVVAAEHLEPGWDVALNGDGHAVSAPSHRDGAVGIVDPFLQRGVKKGEQFYVMLYPGTIEGMRHVWRHKAFAPKAPARREQS